MNTYDPNYVSKKSFVIVAQKAVITNSEYKILVLQRSNKSGAGGRWSLPGGALEHGEVPLEAMQREIREETKLIVRAARPFHAKSYINDSGDFVVIIGYLCEVESDEVTLNWEHDAFAWLTKNEALLLDLTPDGKTFIEQFTPQQSPSPSPK